MITISEDVGRRLNIFIDGIRHEAISWRALTIKLFHGDAASIGRTKAITLTAFRGLENNVHLFIFKSGHIVILCRGARSENLAIASRDFENHFADISKDLETYDLSLPDHMAAFAKATQQAIEANPNKVPSTHSQSRTINFQPTSEEIEALNRTREFSKELRVMLIDDEPMTLKMIELVVKDFKHSQFTNGQSAADHYFTAAPHIVFLDINLTPYSGHDFLREALRYDPNAYIVMLSGNAYVDEIKKAMAEGAKGFIGKPFTKVKIMDYIEKCAALYNIKLPH